MSSPETPTDERHLGYTAEDRARSPYARFFRPEMAPLPEHVREAIAVGPIAPALLPSLDAAPQLFSATELPFDTGFTQCTDGEIRIFDRTDMPGVTPAMWDWWFAWHGSEAARYKLWHPLAHISAKWADGLGETGHYVGRTSLVVEYIGAARLAGAIRFVAPSSLGIDEAELARNGAVAVCARIGTARPAIDGGWLVHHVRPVPGGSEMRSGFWLAGRHIALRGGAAFASGIVRRLAGLIPAATSLPARDLLVHCAQEMNHLAGILPEIYAAFGPKDGQT